MKRCPRCQHGLSEVRIGSIQVEGCAGCGGVWFDNTELGAVANAQAGDLLALEDQFLPGDTAHAVSSQRMCPQCRVALFAFEFPHSPGVQLDACPQCKGIWADEGELQALYVRMTGAQAAAAPQVDTHRAARQAMGLLASRPCPRCQQSNPAAGLACWACGLRLPRTGSLLCPNCDVALQSHSHRGLHLEACPDCTGVWLDAGELSILAECSPEELGRVQDSAAVKRQGISALWNANPSLLCPHCCVAMIEPEQVYASGVRLDACTGCSGVWIGAGKLQTLSRHYTHTLVRKSLL